MRQFTKEEHESNALPSVDRRQRCDLMEGEEFIRCVPCEGSGWILPTVHNPNGHTCYRCGGPGHDGITKKG